MTLEEQFAALSDDELKRFCGVMDAIGQKMKLGMSYSSEFYALSEFNFSDANLLDIDTMRTLSTAEANKRWNETE